MKCKHKFNILDTICTKKEERNFNYFVRVDIFYCEKCLEQKTIKKQEQFALYQSIPDWFK